MIVEKDLATFGYSDEIVRKLEADHHNVCKYSSIQDHNYVIVRDVLRRFVDQLQVKDARLVEFQKVDQVQRLLGISEPPDKDREEFYTYYMTGSCQKFISCQAFKNWLCDPSNTPHIFWVNGLPGVGKSVLSSYIIQQLQERGLACQFYYFRFGDQEKKSIGTFLKSLAYQIAKDVPHFRDRLASLASGPDFNQMDDESDIWKRLFIQQFFRVTFSKPIYWIVDGIDECHSPCFLPKIMATLSGFSSPLRAMFLSRPNDVLSTSFKELSRFMEFTEVSIEADQHDLSQYVREKLQRFQASAELAGFTEDIGGKILGSAKGNFLWTRLALESVLQCKEGFEVEAALRKLYPEIESFYRRMEEILMNALTNRELELARSTLTWTICSRRQLTIPELSEALRPQLESRSDLLSTISRVCGGFVAIDSRTSLVTIVNHSAQEYLTKVSVDLRIELPGSHELLFYQCLSILCQLNSNFPDQDMALDSRLETDALLKYATSSWFYHLSKTAGALEEKSLQLLARFLNESCVLVWISIVASMGQLQVIVEAAEALRFFLLQQPNLEHCKELHHQDNMRIIQSWGVDMLQITTNFGDQLLKHPRAIYSLVPAFSPLTSMVRKSRYIGLASVPSVKVTGAYHFEWDECLARFPVRKNCNASRILCTDEYFAVSTTPLNGPAVDGCVNVYRTRTCEEVATLTQGEAVLNMQFSVSGRFLVTSGTRNIKIWATPAHLSGAIQPLRTLTNPGACRLLALAFSIDDQNIIVYSQDGHIRTASLSSIMICWVVAGVALGGIGTSRVIGPSCAAFNLDASSIAVGFRGAPIAVWKLGPFRPIRHYQRRNPSLTNVNRIEWNHKSGHIIGIFDDGCVFKWHPSEMDEAYEFPASAINIKCNLEGNVLATSSGNSSLTIWDFEFCFPLYELSLPTGVTDLAISPDGRLIYDLRESSCTVWQPNSLTCYSSSSRDMIQKTGRCTPTTGSCNISKDITALVVGQKTFACCIGNMDGVLQIISADDRRTEFLPSFKAPIEHVAWSVDEKYIATANFANQILIRAVELAVVDAGRIIDNNAGQIFEYQLDASVRQLLFNKSSKLIFAATEGSLYVWEFGEQPRLVGQSIAHKQYRWINHPRNDQLLLGFAFDSLKALRWQDLEEEFDLKIKPPPSSNLGVPTSQDVAETFGKVSLASIPSVNRVFTSYDGSMAFLQVAAPFILTRKVHDEFFILHTVGISNSDSDICPHTRLIALPRHLQSLIQVPIGFVNAGFGTAALSSPPSTSDLNESHLAFLSNEGWICTMYLGGEDVPARVKSHYFLPRDWLVTDALDLTEITTTGTLFCPRNGEVGIILNGLGSGWTE